VRLKLLLLGIGLLILGFALALITCPSGGTCSNDAPSVISGQLALAGIVTTLVSIVLSVRDRGRVPGRPVASTSATFLDDLAGRLTSAGFSVRRDFDISPYRLDLLAGRSRFELSKFGKLTRFVAVSRGNSVDIARVQDFSARVSKYALDNPGTVLPRGFGGAVFVIPILVSEDFDETVKKWIAKTSPPKHWAAIEFPVLVSTDQGRVYYCRKTPIWGAAYYRGFRKFVKSMIGDSQASKSV
jgi:hypothetical protein